MPQFKEPEAEAALFHMYSVLLADLQQNVLLLDVFPTCMLFYFVTVKKATSSALLPVT